MRSLINELSAVQDICTALFLPKCSHKWELVVKKEDTLLTTICIGELFGLHTLSTDMSNGIYVEFPKEYPTLGLLLKEPLKYTKWYQENIKIHKS